jgi:hypothetical protein
LNTKNLIAIELKNTANYSIPSSSHIAHVLENQPKQRGRFKKNKEKLVFTDEQKKYNLRSKK